MVLTSRTSSTLTGVAGRGGASTAFAQAAPARKLARVGPEQRKEVPPPSLDDWKKPLAEPDLEKREAAFSELVERARGDQALRESLEQCSKSDAGELACTAPFPSMPLSFCNDVDGTKYRKAFFSRFPNTWCGGDRASQTGRDGIVIGRPDPLPNRLIA
jgi:hypothetical protein